MHEIRAESAETKVAADCKLADACSMVEDAQKGTLILRENCMLQKPYKQKLANIIELQKENSRKLRHVKMIL